MCVGRRINEDGTSDLKEEADPDTKAFLRRVGASRISEIDVPFYKIRNHGQKKTHSTTFQKQ